jgi:hypothetical protein
MKLNRFYCDESEPNGCMACDDDLNACYYSTLVIGNVELNINLCGKCASKLRKAVKKGD